jgi:hypothetical protein
MAVTAKVAAFAAAGTLALGAGLSWQMTRGADPALGPNATLAAPPKPGRRIVKTVVIRKIQAVPNVPSAAPTSSTSSTPAVVAPALVTTSTS